MSVSDMVWRIAAATLAGALVGLERESRGRPAGLRTTILTCVASAVAMIVSEFLFVESAASTEGSNWRPDPARLGAGILTGIGFLGAGTIIRHEQLIRGVTTAASLWFVTVLGLAFGSGLFMLGSVGVAVALVTLMVLPLLEKCIPSDWYASLTVTAEMDALAEQDLDQQLTKLGARILRTELTYNLAAKQKTILVELKMKRRDSSDISRKSIALLRQMPGVMTLKWE